MENAENKILVPIDFSDHSLAGLEQSYSLARYSKSEIILLHVIIESKPLWGMFTSVEQNDMIERIENKLKEYAKLIEEKSNLKVVPMIRKGKLIETILKTSEELKTKMIVVGTTKSTNIRQKMLGSNALRLINEAKCPVVTLKSRHHREQTDNIILPLDLTKETGQKVAKAVSLAKFFDSKIHAVTVPSTKDGSEIESLKNQLHKVKKHIKTKGIECETKLIRISSKSNEKIAQALLDYSKRENGDLMIIMTQQEAEIVEFFIGSLAREVIHHADIPVMSIIPKSKQK